MLLKNCFKYLFKKFITPEVNLFNDNVNGRVKRSIEFKRSIFGNSQ